MDNTIETSTYLHDAARSGNISDVKMLLETYPQEILFRYLSVFNEENETAFDVATREGHSEIAELLARSEAKCQKRMFDFSAKKVELCQPEMKNTGTMNPGVDLELAVNNILTNFKANTTGFANIKDKSFKENQIINITIDNMIKQFCNTSLSTIVPVLQHLSEVAAGHAQQRILAKLNGKQIPWVEHDMHEQYVTPAMTSVEAVMKGLQRDADILKKPFGLRIIVGKGNGSVDKVPKIKNAFLKHLDDNEIEWWYPEHHNTGLVAIVFRPNKSESTDLLS